MDTALPSRRSFSIPSSREVDNKLIRQNLVGFTFGYGSLRLVHHTTTLTYQIFPFSSKLEKASEYVIDSQKKLLASIQLWLQTQHPLLTRQSIHFLTPEPR